MYIHLYIINVFYNIFQIFCMKNVTLFRLLFRFTKEPAEKQHLVID
jgi:hypothetical protein